MRILDVFSCAGLAAIGYHQAGFEVVGVDINPMPRYPYTHIQSDALDILKDVEFCRKFDAIHASPPCQKYSQSTAMFRAKGKVYPDLLAQTRTALDKIGLPYIIENVPNAPIRPDIILYGFMFALNVIRRRHFELGNWWAMQPGIKKMVGSVKDGDFVTVIGKQGYRKYKGLPKGWRPKFDQGNGLKTWHFAMGIPPGFWFKDTEISEGIPPAYTKYIGGLLLEQLLQKHEPAPPIPQSHSRHHQPAPKKEKTRP
jgi:DNA (cytosine-5)-methyltransferase 1